MTEPYPATPARPVDTEVGGIAYRDEFCWLEEDSEEVAAWQAAQTALAGRHLGAGVCHVAEIIEQLTTDAEQQPPRRYGPFWFRERRPAGAQRTVVEVLDDLDGDPRVLLDPAALDDAPTATIMGWAPSPDGSLVAYSLQVGGNEIGRMRVIETATGVHTADDPPQVVRIAAVGWFADSSGFLFTAAHHHDDGRFALTVFRHVLGQPPFAEPEALPPNDHPVLVPQVSDDGRYAVAVGDPRGYRPLYITELSGGGGWRPFLESVPVAASGGFLGDDYIAVTTLDAPRGRIVAIPVATAADTATWRELVAESDAVLTSYATGLQVDGDRLVVTDLVDVAPRVRILDASGAPRHEVALPGPGAVSVVAHDAELTLSFSSLTRSPGVYRWVDGALHELSAPEHEHDDLVLELHRLAGPDGTPLSYHLLCRRDLAGSGPRPVLVHAYGGWNISLMPGYSPEQVAVAKAGAVVLRPHIRGGGEYGHDWWDDGRLLHKHNTFGDLFAVIDHVIAEGVVDPDRVAFEGGSNGGMLAGAVLTQRPDLFRAVAGVVPILDLLRMTRDPITFAAARSDYGDPGDPELAAVLHSYSPYHRVEAGTAYPSSLWLCGANDPRCPAWHGRKMVAALQTASSTGGPHLLSVPPDVGHGSAVKEHLVALNATWVTFVLAALGLLPAPLELERQGT